MNNQPLRAINNTNPEKGAHHTVRPLDSRFSSFGDALFSYLNSNGYSDPDSKAADGDMCRAFCEAMNLPFVSFSSDNMMRGEHYFESDAWFFNYMKQQGFERMGRGNFIKLDSDYHPLAMASINSDRGQNVEVKFIGWEVIVLAAREEVLKHIRSEEAVEERPPYFEVVAGGGRGMLMMGGGDELALMSRTIENTRIAENAYYPYLDGGVDALITDFLQSDESVLILMGAPGTGKSSAIMAATEKLNLLPIYAKKTEVVMDKKFVNFVFGASDTWMAKVAGTAARRRSDLFKEQLVNDREFKHSTSPFKENVEKEEEPRVPVIVVEDADLLLAPRSQGNVAMAELLNETDGISSNHTRKIIFTTNLSSERDIDEALIRDGRCYGVINFRYLTPAEAVAAREAGGLPPFEQMPDSDIPLATALRKPRKRICLAPGKNGIGFTTK